MRVPIEEPGGFWIFGYGSLIWKPPPNWIHAYPGFIRGFVRRFWQASTDHRGTPDEPGRVLTLIKKENWKKFRKFEPKEVLANDDADIIWGVLFCISPEYAESVREQLRIREKCGYSVEMIEVHCPKLNSNTWYKELHMYMGKVHDMKPEDAAKVTGSVDLSQYLEIPNLFDEDIERHSAEDGTIRSRSNSIYEEANHNSGLVTRMATVYMSSIENEEFVGPMDTMEDLARLICKQKGPSGPNSEYLLNIAHCLRFIHPDCAGEEHIYMLEELVRKELNLKPFNSTQVVRCENALEPNKASAVDSQRN